MNTSNSSRKMLFIVLMIFFASSTLASLQNKELGNDLEKRKEGFYSEFLKKHEEQIKPRNKEDLLKTVAMFKEKFLKELDSADWVGKKDIQGQKIQKVEMSDDAEIVMFTDLHSCAKVLKQFLALMHHRGETEKENIFKLKEGKKHLAFLGDYVDRGKEGVDVLHIIFNLFINNPKKVFLLRGNHEAGSSQDRVEALYLSDNKSDKYVERFLYGYWFSYGFELELCEFDIKRKEIEGEYNHDLEVNSKMDRSKVKEIFEKYEDEYCKHLKLFSILEKLSSLLLVVSKNKDNKKRCYLLGHGAIDKNLDLKDILQENKDIAFQKISYNNSTKILWSDFVEKDGLEEDCYVKNSSRGVAHRMGKNVFAKYCKEQSKNRDVEIVGMFRGHQHNDFKKKLNNGNGLYFLDEKKQWNGKTSSFFSINNIKPFVATLAPFRFSKYYDCRFSKETHKATIVSLKLDKDFKKCKIIGEVMNRVREEKKK